MFSALPRAARKYGFYCCLHGIGGNMIGWVCECECVCRAGGGGGGGGGAEVEDMKSKNVGQWFVKHLWNRRKLGSAKKIAGPRNASQINLGKRWIFFHTSPKVVLTAPPTASGQPAAREYWQKTRNSEEVCLDLQRICQYFFSVFTEKHEWR